VHAGAAEVAAKMEELKVVEDVLPIDDSAIMEAFRKIRAEDPRLNLCAQYMHL
jgi:hypothetical protein